MKRVFDLFFSLIFIISISAITLIIWIIIKISSKGPVLYWSDRIEKDNEDFKIAKMNLRGLY